MKVMRSERTLMLLEVGDEQVEENDEVLVDDNVVQAEKEVNHNEAQFCFCFIFDSLIWD